MRKQRYDGTLEAGVRSTGKSADAKKGKDENEKARSASNRRWRRRRNVSATLPVMMRSLWPRRRVFIE